MDSARSSDRFAKFLICFLFSTGIVRAQTSNLSAVWANDGGDKVTRDELRASVGPESVINSMWDGSKIRMFGCRNEVVSFNAILEAAASTADQITLSFDVLTGPGGHAIVSRPATADQLFNWVDRHIELFYIRYLEIKGISTDLFFAGYDYDERHIPARFRRPWTGEGEGTGTWEDRPDHNKFYPEIAVPLELVPGFSIAAGQNQSIWVDIYIPASAMAGLYSGIFSIRENGTPTWEIHVELSVRDFTLPDRPSARTMVYLGYEDINSRYLGEEYPDEGGDDDGESRLIRDRHFLLARRHRVSLIDGSPRSIARENGNFLDRPHPEWLPRLDGSLFTSVNGYAGPGAGVGSDVYAIGTYGDWHWRDEGETAMRTHTDAWVNWFDANAPNTEYFLYLIDESDDYPQIQEWAGWINDNPGTGHRLPSMATIAFPDAVASTPALDIPTSWFNVGIMSEWQNAVDLYQAETDKRIFFYNSNRPGSGSFATEDDGVALRELAWGQYKKGIDRWFYWESTYYHNFQGNTGQTDVFQTAHTFGNFETVDHELGETGWNYLNGDGVLFYPGTDTHYPESSYGVKGPFASLRLKQWRRGIQDVEYLTMAAAVDPVRAGQIVEEMLPRVLWENGVTNPNDPTWVLTDISWSTDPDDWEAARAELADIIESRSTGVTNRDEIHPENFMLHPVYPNPLNSMTMIVFSIPERCEVTIRLFDTLGRERADLLREELRAGTHRISLIASSYPTGLYLITMNAASYFSVKKAVLMK